MELKKFKLKMATKAVYVGGFFVILDEDEASSLYREGFYGRPLGIEKPKTPIFRSKTILSFYEVLYLKSSKRIDIIDERGEEMSDEDIIQEAGKYIENFEIKYAVYKDLKNKGFIPKPGMKFGVTFLVYEYGPGIDHAPFLVHVLEKKEKLEVLEILRAGRLSHSVRKKLVLASVDPSELKIDYYMFRWFE
ncbi:MAG TPA: tRNA-intron lyase [Geobacterales bacterium]|nr:tRNA-intron lyase [Geobacterales bacterium]